MQTRGKFQKPMQLSIHNDDGVIVYGEYTRQAVFDSVNISTDGHIDVFVAKLGLSGTWDGLAVRVAHTRMILQSTLIVHILVAF